MNFFLCLNFDCNFSPNQDYCQKAGLSINVSRNASDGSKKIFSCFYRNGSQDSCSYLPCHANIAPILEKSNHTDLNITVEVCAMDKFPRRQKNFDDTVKGFIWEISFSRTNKSDQLEGYLGKEADEILENLPNHEEFESELSFISIVGGKGVGKSTMASLLSGNSSMFLVN